MKRLHAAGICDCCDAPPATTFRAGQLVEWLYEAHGGYGYRHWVPAVVRTGGEYEPDDWVTIEAKRADGTWRKRRVKAKNLRDAEFAERLR